MPDPWSPEFEIAAASNDKTVVPLETIELIHSGFVEGGTMKPVRAVNDLKAWTLTLEAAAPVNPGQAVTFEPIPFRWSHPDVAEGRGPSAQLEVDNIGKEISPFLDAIETSFEPIVVIFRMYLSTRPTIVDMGPFRFKMIEIVDNQTVVSGRVQIALPQRERFGRRVYEPRYFPGLTEIS